MLNKWWINKIGVILILNKVIVCKENGFWKFIKLGFMYLF